MMAENSKDNLQSHKGSRIKSYELSFKLKVIEFAKEKGNSQASKHYDVDRKRIREWRKNENEIRKTAETTPKNRQRVHGGGRKLIYTDIEEKLIQWIKDRRDKGVRITGKSLKQEARRLHIQQGSQGFKASCGWLRKFMKRNSISFRRRTHVAQKNEEVLGDRMQGFLSFVIKMRKRKNYPLAMIGNMDETPVWIDMPGDYTIEQKGVKTVTMGSTGNEKSRITVCLAAMGDGTKLPPLVLLKGVRPVKDVPLGVHVKMTPAAWANEAVMEHWLRIIWRKNSKDRRLLIWDSFSAHRTENIKKKLAAEYNSDMAVIPGGCTSKLQPCDVSWNKPFKDRYRELYDDWLFSGKADLTKGGNRKPPEKSQILKWIKTAWDSVSPEVVRKSFLKTGICNALDGSEDDLLFASDDEDPFAGFDEPTSGELAGAEQLRSNMELELDAINEWSEPSDDENLMNDSNSESEYDAPSSPGH